MSTFAKSAATALFSGVVGRYQAMLKIEFERAKAEVSAKLGKIGVGSALIGAAAVLGSLALTLLVVAAVAGLSTVWPVWLSALVIAGGIILLVAILAGIGVSLIKKNSDLAPTESINNVKAMFNWE
ncbi:phage holin family protein [Demequina sp. NBRC 110052]|uniref:phage holin family protein n=1 Tax=Demequina sp. NBRC 110052 TaxID=1570341 RepID=UPI000A061D44|nr:phage holin family protein [Demequina sp. NBRC 110052]